MTLEEKLITGLKAAVVVVAVGAMGYLSLRAPPSNINNGICEMYEPYTSRDCQSRIGDGKCDIGENYFIAPKDCAPPPKYGPGF